MRLSSWNRKKKESSEEELEEELATKKAELESLEKESTPITSSLRNKNSAGPSRGTLNGER